MFKILYFLGLIVMSVLRAPYRNQTKTNQIVENHSTILEKILLSLITVGMLILPLLYSVTSLFDFVNYQLSNWIQWLGVLVTIISLWFFWRSHADLGRNWSYTLEIREEHQLITTGIYQYIRHPMYAAILLWSAGQTLLLPNWIAGWSPLLSFLLLYLFRIRNEEQMMLDQFGEEYQAYMKKTGRIIPRMKQRV